MQKASFDIIQNYQLLMIRPIGAWSEDKALAFTQAANRYLTIDEYRFAGLIDIRQWGLDTPEAMGIINNNLHRAAAHAYALEFNFGVPQAIHMQISKERITPSTVDLIQTDDPIQVRQVCAARHYEYDHTELLQFLTI